MSTRETSDRLIIPQRTLGALCDANGQSFIFLIRDIETDVVLFIGPVRIRA